GDITPAQRAAVMTLLQAALSRDGYRKVTDIMHGDEVLRTTGDGRGGRAGGGPAFGEAQYYLAFLGTPSTTSTCILEFGGHHLAINLTLGAIQPEGIRAPALSAPQQTMLLDLAREWVGIVNDAFGEPRMAEIRANLPQTYFAWSGPTSNGSAAYFRIQGPTLVIEYAPQGSVDHIHTIYRDPTNDYGAKFVRR